MKILAIDSSGLVASVAAVEDDKLVAEYTINYKKTHSQTLVPMLDEIKQMTDMDLNSIDGIAVAAGPGSFTGLRIGSATAKGLGLALEKPLIPIPTVDGLAYNLYGSEQLICPIMDARRNQVYTGIYTFMRNEEQGSTSAYHMEVLQEQCAVDISVITEQLNELAAKEQKQVIFLGDGVPVFQEQLKELMHVAYSFAPAFCNQQRASALATLAQSLLKAGKCCTALEFIPEYLRLSQAERERKEKEAENDMQNQNATDYTQETGN